MSLPPQWQPPGHSVSSEQDSVSAFSPADPSTLVRRPASSSLSDCPCVAGSSGGSVADAQPWSVPCHVAAASSAVSSQRALSTSAATPSGGLRVAQKSSEAAPRALHAVADPMSLNAPPIHKSGSPPALSCDVSGNRNGQAPSAAPLESGPSAASPWRRTMGGQGVGEGLPFQQVRLSFSSRVQNGDESKSACVSASSDHLRDAWADGIQDGAQPGSRDRPRRRRGRVTSRDSSEHDGASLSAATLPGGWPLEECVQRNTASDDGDASVAGDEPVASGSCGDWPALREKEWLELSNPSASCCSAPSASVSDVAGPLASSACFPHADSSAFSSRACAVAPGRQAQLAVRWEAFRHPALTEREERERTILRVQEEQRQVLLEIQQQREEARRRGEELPDEPPPELACKMCGVDDSGNLLHPGCVDMDEFLASLGGLYDVGLNQEEEKTVQEELQSLQERLQKLLVKMGRSSGRGEGGGPVSQREPARVPEVVFQNILEKEIRSFQDLVIDEHKEKRKLFRQLAGGCRRHVETVEKKKQMKAEEEERRLRAVAKSTCGPVEVFWRRIERLVWEREKRQLQRQLHEKKKQRLDRLVSEAMQQCRRLAQGLRKPCLRSTAAQHDGSKRLTSETTMSSRRNSFVSDEEAKTERQGPGRSESRFSSGRRAKAKTEGGEEDDGEKEWTASMFAKDQEEEDDRLEAEMEREEDEEQEDLQSELQGLQDEASIPVEELLKRTYGVEGGLTQLASDRQREQKEKAHRADKDEEDGEEEDGEAEDGEEGDGEEEDGEEGDGEEEDGEEGDGEEEDGEEGDGEEEDGEEGDGEEEDRENPWSPLGHSKEQEEEDERLDVEMEKEEEDEQEDTEAELRGLQDEAAMPVDELLKRIYGVEGGEAQLAADKRREVDGKARREKAVKEAEASGGRGQADRQEEREERGCQQGEKEIKAELRGREAAAEKIGDTEHSADDDDDNRSEFSLDGGAFGKQKEEDEELDAAMEAEEEEEEEDELKRLQEDAELPIEELIRRFGAPSSGRMEEEEEEGTSSEDEVVIPVQRSLRRRRQRGDSSCEVKQEASSPCSEVRSVSPGQPVEERDSVKRERGASEDREEADKREAKTGDASSADDSRDDLSRREQSEREGNRQLRWPSLSDAEPRSPAGARVQNMKREEGDSKRVLAVKPSKAEVVCVCSPHSAGAVAKKSTEEENLAGFSSALSQGPHGEGRGGQSSEKTKSASDTEPSPQPRYLSSNPAPALVRATLRTYQSEGVQWLFALHDKGLNGILADEMGLGKTLQTIVLLARLALERGVWGPHLIVVPTSVMLNWEREFFKFCPGFKVLVYFGSAQERAKKRTGWSRPYAFHVCIASYSTVVKDAQIFRRKKWYSLVLDEAQNIKNFHSRRWQTLLTFNTQHRLLLTGTPLQNNLAELWSLMHFLMPTVFQSHDDFKEWFGDPLTAAIEQEQVSEHQQLLEKLHALLRPYLLRRLKKDVEKQMPRKYEHVVRCSLTKRQKCLYDEFMQRRQVQQTMAAGNYRGMMNILMQLRKVCNHPDLFEPRPIETPVGGGGVNALSYDIPAMICLWLHEPWNWCIEERFRRVTLPIISLIHYEILFSSLQHGLAQNLSPLRLLAPASSSSLLQFSPFDLLSAATPLEECDLLSLPQPVYTRRLHADNSRNSSASGPPCSSSCSSSVAAGVTRFPALSPRVPVENQGNALPLSLPLQEDERIQEFILPCQSPESQISSGHVSEPFPGAAGSSHKVPSVWSAETARHMCVDMRVQGCPGSLAPCASPAAATAPSGPPQGPQVPSSSPSLVQSPVHPSFPVASALPLSRPGTGSQDSVGSPPSGVSPNSTFQSHSSSHCSLLSGPAPHSLGEREAVPPLRSAERTFSWVHPDADREGVSASVGGEALDRGEFLGPIGGSSQGPSPGGGRASPLTPVDNSSGPDCDEPGEEGQRESRATEERLFTASGVHASSPSRVALEARGDENPLEGPPLFESGEAAEAVGSRGMRPLSPAEDACVQGFAGVPPSLRAAEPALATAAVPASRAASGASSLQASPCETPTTEKKLGSSGGPPTGLRVSARAAARRCREERLAGHDESVKNEGKQPFLSDASGSAMPPSSVLPLSATKRRRLMTAAMSPGEGRRNGEGTESDVLSLGTLLEVPLLRNTTDDGSTAPRAGASASASSALPANSVSLVLTQPFGSASIPDLDGFLAAHARRRCCGRDRRLLLRNCFPVPPAFVSHLMRQQEDSEKDGKVMEDEDLVLNGDAEAAALSSGLADSLSSRAGAAGGTGGVGSPPALERGGKARRQAMRGIKRAGTLWRRWISSERCEMQPALCLVDATGGESFLDSFTPGESEFTAGEDRGMHKDTQTTFLARPAEPFSAAVDANEGTRMRKAEFWRSEEMRCEASQAMFLFASSLSLASPPLFGGRDTRELLRKEICQSPLNPVGSVHEPIRASGDFLARTETLRRITPTPTEVFERDQSVILRCSVLCNPRVQPGPPRIFLRGPGGIQARENSFSAFAESLEFLQGSAAELHEAVERQRRIFPHKQTLQDDCGKLIVLAELLTKLRADGHRCLLFTQFSKMLDVLESWINHQGFTYVRLDGSTKVDQRQRVVTRFNANPRIFLFISSTRAGGVGLNLTGADTVIFYDTDWNPAMDRQAMDRCHRIGQTRDVHVYRLVTEHSIEENIWRKQLQKRLLDEVVVDRGLFTMENTTREGHLGQQTQDKEAAREWFANAETLKDLLASPEESRAKSGFKDDIYADRILHDSAEDNPDDTEASTHVPRSGKRGAGLGGGGEFEAAILEVEDVEDVAAMQQTTREEKQAKQELQQDFRGEKVGEEGTVDLNGALERMPALAAYCVRLINENKPPSLLAQIAQLKTQVRAEGDEDEEKPNDEDRQSESEEPQRSSEDDGPALWESEIESTEEDDE
ncbi:SWI2/SNF2 SRCAP/Ino80 [Toxoplasma gondii VEG]|uniref:SNF2 family N-terminal domain-containing protein n=1 Tax=Toxoplasma gondii (strain ATCC 50861 / VEG) TaxID=432359 RepID=B9QPR3_TOXGV|nr:SWI2/SNF2 SRCAP/Ino80 [Toxoplasma gondii VEG]CEL73529.1 TPA: SNF2 family N-terminal domain-containing protein [Toxoplasma gondii VEG]